LSHQFGADWKLKIGGQTGQADVAGSYFNYGFRAGRGQQSHQDLRLCTAQIEVYGNLTTGPVRPKLLFGTE